MQLTQLSIVFITVLDALAVVLLLPVVLDDPRATLDPLLVEAAVVAAVPEVVAVDPEEEALVVVALELVVAVPLFAVAPVLLVVLPVVSVLVVVTVLPPVLVLLDVVDAVEEPAVAVVAPTVEPELPPMLQPAISVSINAPMAVRLLVNQCAAARARHRES